MRAPRSDDTSLTSTADRIPDPAGVPLETVWSEEWEKNVLAAALEAVKRLISPKQFQMFDMHVLQNLSVQDTVRTLRVSAASVYMAKHRVTRLVRREVKRLEQKFA